MDKKHNDAEDIEKEDADIETEETEESEKESRGSGQKKEKPQLKKKPKKEEDEDEYEDEEYEDDDDEYDDDDDDEGGGKTKIVIISVIIAAAVAAAGIFTYSKIIKNDDQQQEQTIEEQQAAAQAEQERLQKENEAESQENSDNEEPEETETPTPTEEPIATSTPKPLPTATSTPTPFPEETYEDNTYNTNDSDDGTVNVSNDGTTGGIDNNTTEAEPTQAPASVIFIGDSRFRAMANIATENSDLWECSSSGDYNWLTGTAYSDVDPRIGKDTKVFISMGINDLTQYQSYASSIVAKAQEWMNKGATVYFVAVGPVGTDSYISNQDISNFNTYMYQSLSNAGIPFIDAYNYLVQAGFETTDGENYTDMTSMALYNYINSLIGR